jgi:Domain of unknown function (DUF4166)
MTVPLYRRLLGPKFDMLPPRVRELHDLAAPAMWEGRADVERGVSLVARAAATLFALPPTGRDQALSVTFTPDGSCEIWRRAFGGAVFWSVQYEHGGRLFERVRASTLVFTLDVAPDGLSLVLVGVRFLGIPLPRPLHPAVRTLESEHDGRYRFEVEATLPRIGLLVRYSGWLEKIS